MQLNIHHFVITSVLAHVAIFAAWSSTASQQLRISPSKASAPTLHVSFQTEKAVVHKHLVRHMLQQHKVRQALAHQPTPKQQLARTRETTTPMPNFVHRTTSVAKTNTTYQAQQRREAIRSRVLAKIRTDLRQYFVYPLLAQRRGWQGRVVLAFSVEANGTIQHIRVASGSGYSILDTSAVTALSRVHQLYPNSHQQQGLSMQLQLPVIFELQGG